MTYKPQAGDGVWVYRRVDKAFPDGYIKVAYVGEEHGSEVLPNSDHLYRVAQWLAANAGEISHLKHGLYELTRYSADGDNIRVATSFAQALGPDDESN